MLTEIITRLEELKPATLKTVEGAIEFAAIKTAPAFEKLPAAFVVPLGFDAGENKRANGVLQLAPASVGVILILGSRRDATGEAAAAALESVYQAVRAKLLGFVPPDGNTQGALTFAGADLLMFKDGAVWWQESFGVDTYVTA